MQGDILKTTGCFCKYHHAASLGLVSLTLVHEASDPQHGQVIHVAFIRMSVRVSEKSVKCLKRSDTAGFGEKNNFTFKHILQTSSGVAKSNGKQCFSYKFIKMRQLWSRFTTRLKISSSPMDTECLTLLRSQLLQLRLHFLKLHLHLLFLDSVVVCLAV